VSDGETDLGFEPKNWKMVLVAYIGKNLDSISKWASLFGIAFMMSYPLNQWAGQETTADISILLKLMTGGIIDWIEWIVIGGQAAFIYAQRNHSEWLRGIWSPINTLGD